MAATIEAGAPPLQTERPDLPKRLLAAVGHAVALDPAKRPSAAALASELRGAVTERKRSKRAELAIPKQTLLRLAPAAAAGGAALIGATALPFYPTGWAPALAVVAAIAALRVPRLGLALALAAPILPLGNLALGLALVYAAVAVAWLVLSWRDTRAGLLFLAGPALAPLGLLALVPVFALAARGAVRRGAQAIAAVAVAAIVAGMRNVELPFSQGVTVPLGLAGTESVTDTVRALGGAVPPGLALEALALAAIAVAIPYARTPWRIAGLGAGALAATLLAAPAAPALPLVLAVWLTCAGLALKHEH